MVGSVISRQLFFLRELKRTEGWRLMRYLGYSTRKYYGGHRSRFPTSGTAHPSREAAPATLWKCLTGSFARTARKRRWRSLDLRTADVDFLAVADANGDAVPVINFRTADVEDPPWAARAVRLAGDGCTSRVGRWFHHIRMEAGHRCGRNRCLARRRSARRAKWSVTAPSLGAGWLR